MFFNSKLHSIIIAAGRGSRAEFLTRHRPKGMIEWQGTTLLERQIDMFRSEDIKDISIIKGYKADTINFDNIKYFLNKNYETNNVLESLFVAKRKLKGNVIVSYSDIVYCKSILHKLIEVEGYDIVLVVNLLGKYGIDDEIITFDESPNSICNLKNIYGVGVRLPGKFDPTIAGEFIGLMKFSPQGIKKFKYYYNLYKELDEIGSKSYITDLLWIMYHRDVKIGVLKTFNKSLEIDTVEDWQILLNRGKEIINE